MKMFSSVKIYNTFYTNLMLNYLCEKVVTFVFMKFDEI